MSCLLSVSMEVEDLQRLRNLTKNRSWLHIWTGGNGVRSLNKVLWKRGLSRREFGCERGRKFGRDL